MNTMICTRCDGTGFLNLEQVDEATVKEFEETGDHQIIFDWIKERDDEMGDLEGCTCHIAPPCSYCILKHDVQVCDCCGDGCEWYGEPGKHDWNNPNDPKGCR